MMPRPHGANEIGWNTRSSPPDSLHLNWLLDDVGAVGASPEPALEAGLKRLAAVVRFLPIPRNERDDSHALDRIPATWRRGPSRAFGEAFTIVGVFRERGESDDLAAPWPRRSVTGLPGISRWGPPPATAAEFYSVRPTRQSRVSTKSL